MMTYERSRSKIAKQRSVSISHEPLDTGAIGHAFCQWLAALLFKMYTSKISMSLVNFQRIGNC